MRKPKKPPTFYETLVGLPPDRLIGLWNRPEVRAFINQANHRYWSWDKVRSHLPKPEGVDDKLVWTLVKLSRAQQDRLELYDKTGNPFTYWLPSRAQADLHEIDMQMGGTVEVSQCGIDVAGEPRYLIRNLMEEAIASSQIEGAVATREQAREMLRQGRQPQNESEKMILNNFLTIRKIGELKDQPLTLDMINEIQAMLTKETLKKPDASGRFRRKDESVHVFDIRTDEIVYTPPPAEQLEDRMNRLCMFANQDSSTPFIHPVVKAILLHFWLAYDHPYWDGNGRTARALFYWYMLRKDYWRFEYISISQIINTMPIQYGMAYLNSEVDENDLTYFLMYHLKVIRKAMQQLDEYLSIKQVELQEMTRLLHKHKKLNHRQKVLLYHAIRHPNFTYTIESHMNSNGITYPTARSDLLKLSEEGYLIQTRAGRKFKFTPIPNLYDHLQQPITY